MSVLAVRDVNYVNSLQIVPAELTALVLTLRCEVKGGVAMRVEGVRRSPFNPHHHLNSVYVSQLRRRPYASIGGQRPVGFSQFDEGVDTSGVSCVAFCCAAKRVDKARIVRRRCPICERWCVCLHFTLSLDYSSTSSRMLRLKTRVRK